MTTPRQEALDRIKTLVSYVRSFLRDHAELNRMVEGREHSDRLIAMALFDTVDQLKTMPPDVSVDLGNVPISLLRKGATIFLIESVGLLMVRNQLNYRTGRGTGIGIQDKAPLLMNWIQMLKQDFMQAAKDWKVSRNLEEAMRGSVLYSEYSLLNGLYGYWGIG